MRHKIEQRAKELFDAQFPQIDTLDMTWENHKDAELPDYIHSFYRLAKAVLISEVKARRNEMYRYLCDLESQSYYRARKIQLESELKLLEETEV